MSDHVHITHSGNTVQAQMADSRAVWPCGEKSIDSKTRNNPEAAIRLAWTWAVARGAESGEVHRPGDFPERLP